MFSTPGETVFDGSATIATAGLRLGRKVAVADLDKAVIELGVTRCKQFLNWFVERDLIPLGNKPSRSLGRYYCRLDPNDANLGRTIVSHRLRGSISVSAAN